MKYNILTHDLLSDEAQALDEGPRTAHADVAEMVLGIHDTNYTGEDATRLALAVVLTVNYRLEKGLDADVYSSTSRGAVSSTYRGEHAPPPAPLEATMIVDRVVGYSGWPAHQGYR